MQLFLLRHGDAEYGLPEVSRPLTALGRKQISKTANSHRAQLADVEIVLSSQLNRAVQSADILVEQIGLSYPRQQVDFLDPDAEVSEVEQYLQATQHQVIMMVGHLPLLTVLIDYLTGSSDARMGTASLASLSIDYLGRGSATLNWIHYAS
jgi:phosphohistidine phosphatase